MVSNPTFSSTRTDTYTVTDVRKTFSSFSADLDMIAQSSRTLNAQEVENYASDIKVLAENGLIATVHLIHRSSSGVDLRANRYEISESAGSWKANRPGDNLWPYVSGASLAVVLSPTSTWNSKYPTLASTMHINWSDANVDLSFPGLAASGQRHYASNAYGIARTDLR